MDSLGLIFDNLKDVLERQLLKIEEGRTAWMFGYRIHPVTKKPQLHNGVDLPNPTGYPIKAPLKGKIVKAWFDDKNGGGNSIVLSHQSKFFTRTGYAHLNAFAKGIVDGMEVEAGMVIGFVGSTGTSTGPHLHFTLRNTDIGGALKCVDPLPFLCAASGVVEMPIHLVG